MQYTRHEQTRRIFWALGSMLAGLVLWQCGSGGRATDAGTLSMNLVAHVNGSTYRLRDAVFAVSGPEALELSTEGSPGDLDEGETTGDGSGCSGAACDDALTASLLVGDYQILLREGWRLERDSGAGFDAVASRLASANPAGFAISEGTTTSVVFSFEADGRVIPFDRGTLEVTIEVEERDGLPVFDTAACDFEDVQGCEALTCEQACATNDGGFCSSLCADVMECVASNVERGSCAPTEADPMCAVRSSGVPSQCTVEVERAGGPNVQPPAAGQAPLPAFVARELVRCLCSTPRP